MKQGKDRRRGRITNEKTANGYISNAMSCPPSQYKQFNDEYKRRGISGVEHRPDGSLEIRSNKGRAQVMKLRGWRDKDAGYGDWAGN